MMIHWERLDEPIAELEGYGLSLRLINMLEHRRGWMYIRDLQPMQDEDILDIRDFGPPCLRELKQALRAYMTANTVGERVPARYNRGKD